MSTSVENYESAVSQIEASKGNVLEILESLHVKLCTLSEQERALEAAKEAARIEGEDISGAQGNYLAQIKLPAHMIWSEVNRLMDLVRAHNAAGVTSGFEKLPEIFKRNNRFEDFSNGIAE